MKVVDLFLQMAGRVAAPSGAQARLPIIFYHRVLSQPDPLLPDTPDVRLFDIHMRTLSRVFRIVSLEEGVAALRAGTLPSRAVCVTFDDGYRDNYEIALPVLQRHAVTATFFVASGFLGNGRLFADTVIESIRRLPAGKVDLGWFGLGIQPVHDAASRLALIDRLVAEIKYRRLDSRKEACDRIAHLSKQPLPDDLMMSPEQLRAMHRAGMSVGGHTLDHPILGVLHPEDAQRQIVADRADIAAIIGTPPSFFAYPNGRVNRDFGASHVALVRDAGYAGAVTTDAGCASSSSDPFLLPRQSPWQRTPLRLAAGIARSMRSRSDGRQPGAFTPASA
jgi:peptidoglycan/xylan/chitin deacetylase (PgdA/CDA1 family)